MPDSSATCKDKKKSKLIVLGSTGTSKATINEQKEEFGLDDIKVNAELFIILVVWSLNSLAKIMKKRHRFLENLAK